MKQQFSLMLGVVSVVSLVVALGVGQQAAAQSPDSQVKSGKQVYYYVCFKCHETGVMGAPKVGDPSAWKSIIKQGKQILYQHSINGFGAMPVTAGSSLSDSHIKGGVDYLFSQVSGGGGGQQAAAQSSGKQAYDQVCARCHATGMLGAPKVGSESAWASRIKKGKQALYQNAINGIGIIMPPKGGSTLPDSQVKAAVDYMLAQVSHGGGGGGGDHGRAR